MDNDIKFGERRPLPDRTNGYTQKVEISGREVYLRTREYADGTLGSIEIDIGKEGDGFRAIVRGIAQAVSIGLQYGVPLEKYVDEYTYSRFEPGGKVEGNDCILSCTSLLDYVFRELAISYLDRTDLAHVKPPGIHVSDIGEQLLAQLLVQPAGIDRQRVPRSVITAAMKADTPAICINCGEHIGSDEGVCDACDVTSGRMK